MVGVQTVMYVACNVCCTKKQSAPHNLGKLEGKNTVAAGNTVISRHM